MSLARRALPPVGTALAAAVTTALLLLAAAPGAPAAEPSCAACGRPIEGERVDFEGASYHPDHFVCAHCGRPMRGEVVTAGGRLYHGLCWKDNVAPRCGACGKPIGGDYVVQESVRYHRSCWEDRVALRCSLCGGILQGTFLTDSWGNRYHSHHRTEAPECEYCGRFISEAVTRGGVRYADGREVCSLCRRTAVDDRAGARRLMEEVSRRLADAGLEVDAGAARLELVDRGEMERRAGRGPKDRVGHTEYVTTESRTGGLKIESVQIRVLAGMPRLDAVAALAHELTHVWLAERARPAIARPLAEGSCNYAALLVLQAYPGRESEFLARRMLGSPDPVYGEGLRRVRRFVEAKGAAAWLALLREKSDLPPGF